MYFIFQYEINFCWFNQYTIHNVNVLDIIQLLSWRCWVNIYVLYKVLLKFSHDDNYIYKIYWYINFGLCRCFINFLVIHLNVMSLIVRTAHLHLIQNIKAKVMFIMILLLTTILFVREKKISKLEYVIQLFLAITLCLRVN